jgi:signal transduction histidine kinase
MIRNRVYAAYDQLNMSTAHTPSILSHATRLVTALHAALVVLVLASVVRYLTGHGFDDRGPWVLVGAVVLLATYAAYRVLPSRVWLALLVLEWCVLVLLAPSFAWCAVPLSFVALRILSFRPACLVVAGMVVVTVVQWTRMTDRPDPTIVLGPVCVAVLAVGAYRALERDALARQALLDELHAAQGDLADAQHQAGVMAERARLSREIHDSVAQGLSSINLLLRHATDSTRPGGWSATWHPQSSLVVYRKRSARRVSVWWPTQTSRSTCRCTERRSRSTRRWRQHCSARPAAPSPMSSNTRTRKRPW